MIFSMLSCHILVLAIQAATRAQYPETSRSLGFTLIANITDTSKIGIFNDPIHNWPFTSIHTGAGLNTGIIRQTTRDILFVNGTLDQVAAMGTRIWVPPLLFNQDPWGMEFGQSTPWASGYVSIDVGRAADGAGVLNSARSPYPTLYTPAPFNSLRLFVCNETLLTGVVWYPQYGVKQADVVPDNCAEMVLLAQCATLPLPLKQEDRDGHRWNSMPQEVDCYPNVSAINWNTY